MATIKGGVLSQFGDVCIWYSSYSTLAGTYLEFTPGPYRSYLKLQVCCFWYRPTKNFNFENSATILTLLLYWLQWGVRAVGLILSEYVKEQLKLNIWLKPRNNKYILSEILAPLGGLYGFYIISSLHYWTLHFVLNPNSPDDNISLNSILFSEPIMQFK